MTIDCRKVTIDFHGFNSVEGSPNHVVESVRLREPVEWVRRRYRPESIFPTPVELPPQVVSFTGTDATNVQRIAFPVGEYVIVVHAKWNTNGYRGHVTLHSRVFCNPAPAYTIHTVQSIAGSGQAPTAEPLPAKVGQVIDYSTVVQDTGNTPLTFSNFRSRCDPGTLTGTSLAPVEPSETLTLNCSHTVTSADHAAGFYMNVASIEGAPEPGEGRSSTQESNAVVATPIAEEPVSKEEEKPAHKTEQKTTTTGTASGGVLSFTSATVPAIKGPAGVCAARVPRQHPLRWSEQRDLLSGWAPSRPRDPQECAQGPALDSRQPNQAEARDPPHDGADHDETGLRVSQSCPRITSASPDGDAMQDDGDEVEAEDHQVRASRAARHAFAGASVGFRRVPWI